MFPASFFVRQIVIERELRTYSAIIRLAQCFALILLICPFLLIASSLVGTIMQLWWDALVQTLTHGNSSNKKNTSIQNSVLSRTERFTGFGKENTNSFLDRYAYLICTAHL